ncbi:sigma-54 interaction domain-containing protein [Burkholderia sp. PU8-34]
MIETNRGAISAMRGQALQALFEAFERLAEGAFVVDRSARILWANDRYLAFIGMPERSSVIGRHIAEVVPTTQMPLVVETGQSIPFDLIEVNRSWAVVSRFPIKDEKDEIIGGFCVVLYNDIDVVRPIVDRVNRLRAELDSTKSKLNQARRPKYSFSQFVGNSASAQHVKSQGKRAAASDSTVLLLGETGTGKELIAHSIHAASSRADRNFVALNVSAVPEELVEAEFFGVAPGAYTGASPKGRIGKMALANGGTLFLDEVADMPMRVQVKLLRALQEREIEAVGSNTVTPIDIRLIAATSKDIEQAIRAGTFRPDLYYRLNVVPIRIASLRERAEDIPMLADVLLESVCQSLGVPVKEFEPAALAELQSRPWPGNVRELLNVIERMCVLSSSLILTLDDVLNALDSATGPGKADRRSSALRESVTGLEREMIVDALQRSGGNKLRAAKLLGIARSNLYKKLQEYDL